MGLILNSVYDAEWDSFILIDCGLITAVGNDFLGKAAFQAGVWLVGGVFYWVGESIHEVGRYNLPPFLIKLIFPKLVQNLLGVVGMVYSVHIELEDINLQKGLILDIMFYQKGV